MFSIIPQSYIETRATFSSPDCITTTNASLLVPGKVTAVRSLDQGQVSAAISPKELLGRPDVMQISVKLNASNVIDLEPNSRKTWPAETHWVRAIRLSDDCHSYNVQLKRQNAEEFYLQVVRPIEGGHELLLWFSDEILSCLQIAFLTPSNIQGQKKYVCMKCSALFECPNPLKLHISLNCGQKSVFTLWERLADCDRSEVGAKQQFDFKLSQEPQINRQKSAIDLSVSHKEIFKPYQCQSSAFKPFRKVDAGYLQPLVENVGGGWPIAPFEQHNFHLQQVGGEDEAHIETLVSSLGKSKQGHICLYCGKCYSRKYGLKIHIRTHTGYKPLKCKFCMRPFGDPSNLNKHVRLHAEGNTPYKCDLCGKILVRRRDLDRHLKSRHMIEMHPGLNILDGDYNPDEELKSGDEVKEGS